MSKVYSLIDDDHIDDQETINVGNLIIDLESVLEKEKIENEQQANNNNVSTPTTTTNNMFNNNNNNNNKSQTTSTTTSIETKSTSSSTNSKNSAINKLSLYQKTQSNSNNNNSIFMTNNSNNSNNNINDGTTKSVYKSGGEIKMRIARETKAGKSEHKIVSSPNQKSPTSSSGTGNVTIYTNNNSNNNIASATAITAVANINNNNHYHHKTTNSEDNIFEPTQSSTSSISSTKECGTSTSIGTITEPECLGPCEPGTSVTLEGIVWQETEGGILVVNVTWRGKTYVGALLDCTKHDWAPPRLCDSPASDIDSKAHKGVRTKRIVTRSNGIGLDEKNLLQTTGKLRNGKGRRILTTNDLAPCNKRQRESDKTIENMAVQAEVKSSGTSANVSSITNSDSACVPVSIDTTPPATNNNNEQISTTDTLSNNTGPNSPMLIGCGEPNCSKKYRNMNGLLYHQAHAHGNNNDNSSNAKDKIESPTDSTDSLDNEEKPSEIIEMPQQDTRRCELDNEQNSSKIKYDENLHEKPVSTTASNIETPNKTTATISIPTTQNNNLSSVITNQSMEQSPSIIRFHESEKRSSNSSSHDIMNNSHVHRKSPIIDNCNSNIPKQKHQQLNNQPPPPPPPSSSQLNSNIEEGMKPSGTSTGPPPAPHQANCFFNSPFMAGVPNGLYNPFGTPYLPRPLTLRPPMYDQLTQLMNSMRVPPLPESPSRLLSPSVPKNLPFPPYKVEPGQHVPTSSSMTNSPMPNMPPMMNSHLGGGSGSPHPMMPGQIDPMLPPGLTPFPPPPPIMNVPPNPLNPLSRPPVPNLLDDPLSKQYPRRFS